MKLKINLIVFNVTPFGLHHLWFILALIYCFILYYVLVKFKVNPNTLYKFAPILIILCLVIGEFLTLILSGIYAKDGVSSIQQSFLSINYYRNFIFMGLPFFTLGYLIHDKKDILTENISNSSLIAFGIFGLLLTVLEVLVVGKLDIYIGTIIFSLCIFILCIKNPDSLNFKITNFIGGKLYILIYILHLMILWIINPQFGYLNPIVCFIPTTIISAIIYFILKAIGWEK